MNERAKQYNAQFYVVLESNKNVIQFLGDKKKPLSETLANQQQQQQQQKEEGKGSNEQDDNLVLSHDDICEIMEDNVYFLGCYLYPEDFNEMLNDIGECMNDEIAMLVINLPLNGPHSQQPGHYICLIVDNLYNNLCVFDSLYSTNVK